MAFQNRVASIAGVTSFGGPAVKKYATVIPGGPAGSALMTFFAVFTIKRAPTTQTIFARTVGTGGWYIQYFGGLRAVATNSTPAAVATPALAVTQSLLNTPLIFVARYINGTIQGWLNGVSVGITTLGAGYTPENTASVIGGFTGGQTALDCIIHEAGMLDAYDVAASIATVNAQWQEDLQQGRYLAWPRAAVVNSDWYWSARDVCLGGAIPCAATWIDRYSSVSMARAGLPQAASVPGRFG